MDWMERVRQEVVVTSLRIALCNNRASVQMALKAVWDAHLYSHELQIGRLFQLLSYLGILGKTLCKEHTNAFKITYCHYKSNSLKSSK